jgi:signal transduction histidine kinase
VAQRTMDKSSPLSDILLITHDLEQQQLARRTLGNEGFRVHTAPKWQTAVALTRESRPGLILVDFGLPGIDGNLLAARLQGLPGLEETPIVALISEGQDVLAAVCSGQIQKPLRPRELSAGVKRFLAEDMSPLTEAERVEQLCQLVHAATDQLEKHVLLLEAKERRLREANRLRANFLTNVSRELRTPLTLISGYVTLLQSMIPQLDIEDIPLPLDEMIKGLAQGTKRMNTVVHELMRVSRIVTGDVNLAIGPTRIGSLIAATLNDLADQERDAVRLGNLDRLPLIQADGVQIRLALRNVLTHLLGIIPSSGSIMIDGEFEQDIVIVSMQGTGIRIDPAEQDMLFDRLYPVRPDTDADSQPAADKSLGFGLAVAYGIVQAHNGRIWIESTGQGEQARSTFYLLLPIVA